MIYGTLIDPLVSRLRRRIVALCRALGAGEVLDIACATGAQVRLLDAAGIDATGLDLSEAMIDAARRAGGCRAEFVCASAYELPFEEGAFDASILSLALHEHTESERGTMLREALRVVRPDGALIVADYRRPQRPRFHPPWWTICAIERMAGSAHRKGFAEFVATGSLDGLLTRHDLQPSQTLASHVGAIGIAVIRKSRSVAAESGPA